MSFNLSLKLNSWTNSCKKLRKHHLAFSSKIKTLSWDSSNRSTRKTIQDRKKLSLKGLNPWSGLSSKIALKVKSRLSVLTKMRLPSYQALHRTFSIDPATKTPKAS